MSAEKPTILEAGPLVQELYIRNGVGCCLHIVLDDGNVEDGHVRFCIDYAQEQSHLECARLAEMLLRMSKTQRMKLYRTHGKSGS